MLLSQETGTSAGATTVFVTPGVQQHEPQQDELGLLQGELMVLKTTVTVELGKTHAEGT